MPRLIDKTKSILTSQSSKAAERQFQVSLNKIARQSAMIVKMFTSGAYIKDPDKMNKALRDYADLITPWAEAQSARLMLSTLGKTKRELLSYSKKIGAGLREEIENTSVGGIARALQAEQVELIKSLPIEAGLRAQKLSMEAVLDGRRADEVAKEIARTEQVTMNRAATIARTETSKAASAITQARAESVGSDGYIWRTGRDSDVRPSHREMEGKYVRWDSPPTLDNMTGHAGEFPNCRCYAEVILPTT
jgi:SPP1 gp7 family putative phage head morphogenesis protein